jgi:hypothetical protein
VTGWQYGTYTGPMCDPNGLVNSVELAEWAGVTLSQTEDRLDSPGGPRRLRIAGLDYYWVHDVIRFLTDTSPTDGAPFGAHLRTEVVTRL